MSELRCWIDVRGKRTDEDRTRSHAIEITVSDQSSDQLIYIARSFLKSRFEQVTYNKFSLNIKRQETEGIFRFHTELFRAVGLPFDVNLPIESKPKKSRSVIVKEPSATEEAAYAKRYKEMYEAGS